MAETTDSVEQVLDEGVRLFVSRNRRASAESFEWLERLRIKRAAEISRGTWERLFTEWQEKNVQLDRRFEERSNR
jgi:hypothetical protein